MKRLLVFLAVALALPLATAFNCTALDGENQRVCNYVENTDWSQHEKDIVIQDIVNSGGSLSGNFDSLVDEQNIDIIKLNKLEDYEIALSDENKTFLIDFSSISFFGYVLYAFSKKYYLLLQLL